MPEEIIKTDVISKDKDGTLEKVYFKPVHRTVKKDDGTEETKLVHPWEIRATGRKTKELKGAFKDSAPEMMHEGYKEWQDHGGDLKITRPDGSVDTIRADKEELYRRQPGFCVTAVRPTFGVNGFGRLREQGIIRQKVKWTKEGKYTETTYADGRKGSVLEERQVG